MEGVNWIMGCVTSTCFVVLVNGTPSYFFQDSRGIRQGFPLSLLLFILIIESLSLIISDTQRKGHIRQIHISQRLSLTHLFFVDDVILFGLAIVEEWHAFKEALDLFCSATGMTISREKSSFLYNEVDEDTRRHISVLLPYRMEPIFTGFKYMGYRLKPLGYRFVDWRWLVEMFEKRINNWTYR